MAVLDISVEVIDVLSGDREDDEKSRDELCLSIQELGLLQPIVVVPSSEIPGRYSVIAGRRRLQAVKRLKWEKIDCTVRSLEETQSEMIEISENLHRQELSQMERDRAMSRYMILYEARHPELKGLIQERKERNLRKGSNGSAREESESSSPVKPYVTAHEAAAKAFKVHPATIRKAVKRADLFTDDERQILDLLKTSTDRIDRLARIPDRAERLRVINLLSAQMPFSEAMAEVLGDRWEGEDPSEDLTDEEFLEACPIRDKVCKEKFDDDALLYRSIQKEKLAFSRKIGWTKTKSLVANRGIYFRRLMLLLTAKHPRDWVTCGNCVRGICKTGSCNHCKGGGYQIG